MDSPVVDEHLIVLVAPDRFECGVAGFVTRSYNKNLCRSLSSVSEVHIAPSGDMKLSVRMSDGRTPLTRASICSRCREQILWTKLSALQEAVASLEHRLSFLEKGGIDV